MKFGIARRSLGEGAAWSGGLSAQGRKVPNRSYTYWGLKILTLSSYKPLAFNKHAAPAALNLKTTQPLPSIYKLLITTYETVATN